MRSLHPAALLLSVGALALAGCGGSDGDEAASTTPATTDDAPAATTTQAAPVTTATVETTVTTTPTVTATTPGGTTTSAEPSGGTAPPSGEPDDAGSTSSGGTAPSADPGGDQPTITVNGPTARAIADDPSVAEIWCDAARGGAYAQQLADATVLQITVRGSDDVQRCELPR